MRILREMAIEMKGATGLNYREFRRRLAMEDLSAQQNGPLKLRLDILESFMHSAQKPGTPSVNASMPKFNNSKAGQASKATWMAEQARASAAHNRTNLANSNNAASAWQFPHGSLTIVDLSCPFVDAPLACTLFGIALDLFLASSGAGPPRGRVVALDEAHKFLTRTAAAQAFTERLAQLVRLQRHMGVRVAIATQEPTLGPELLDLSSVAVVHRFTSPAWMVALREHLAGVAVVGVERDKDGRKRDVDRLFAEIVRLDAGEALVFSPAAMLNVVARGGELEPAKLGSRYIKMRVRKRLTADGGRSVRAV